MRLFIAIDIPTHVQTQLAGTIDDLKRCGADVRWEQPRKLHITLKFLGDVNEELLALINTQLEQAIPLLPSCTVRFSGLGCFPNRKEPRIVWLGVQDQHEALTLLATAIDESLSAIGFARDPRTFHPHITIGRVKSQRRVNDLLRTMESATLESDTTNVSYVVLMKSELKPTGSEYSVLRRFPLSART